MTRTERLLIIIADAAATVSREAMQAVNFGLATVESGQEQTNAQRLMEAVNDFVAVYQMLAGPVVSPTSPLFRGDPQDWAAAIMRKQQEIQRCLAGPAAGG